VLQALSDACIRYGTTFVGGASNLGTVFRLDPTAPTMVAALKFRPGRVSPGGRTTGTVTLSSPAPAGGLIVDVSNTNAALAARLSGSAGGQARSHHAQPVHGGAHRPPSRCLGLRDGLTSRRGLEPSDRLARPSAVGVLPLRGGRPVPYPFVPPRDA
jgi:uncharacterized repeat protein (TIGR03803 family)